MWQCKSLTNGTTTYVLNQALNQIFEKITWTLMYVTYSVWATVRNNLRWNGICLVSTTYSHPPLRAPPGGHQISRIPLDRQPGGHGLYCETVHHFVHVHMEEFEEWCERNLRKVRAGEKPEELVVVEIPVVQEPKKCWNPIRKMGRIWNKGISIWKMGRWKTERTGPE